MDDSKLLRSYARRVVSAELASYDKMSTPSRIRYEHAIAQHPTPLDSGVFQCAHRVWLYQCCAKCQRGPDEALVYALQMKSKLAELLALLPIAEPVKE